MSIALLQQSVHVDIDLGDQNRRSGELDVAIATPDDLAAPAGDVDLPGASVGARTVLPCNSDSGRADSRAARARLPHASLMYAEDQVTRPGPHDEFDVLPLGQLG